MPVKPIPDGMSTVTPYLILRGVPQLIEFMKQSFGAVEVSRDALPDGTVMHAMVRIGNSNVMMGEPGGQWQPIPASLHVYVENIDAVYERAIRAGAQSLREPTNQFYGDRSAGVKDAFGNLWWIATHVEDVSSEEMRKRSEAWAASRKT